MSANESFDVAVVISRLYMDITALLIAAELNILEDLENAFAPIFLPPSINNAILSDLQKATHPQPKRLAALELIKEFVEQKKIVVCEDNVDDPFVETHPQKNVLGASWVALLNEAKSRNGYLIDFLPITRGEDLQPVELSVEDSKHVTGIDSVFASLVAEGKLSQKEQIFAKEHLKYLSINKSEPAISIGTSLYLHGNIIESIIAVELLLATCANFSVHIQKVEFEKIKNELLFEEWSERFRRHLKQLVEHIRQGLLNGKYQLITLNDSRPKVPHELANPEALILD